MKPLVCNSPFFGTGEIYSCQELNCPIHGERNRLLQDVKTLHWESDSPNPFPDNLSKAEMDRYEQLEREHLGDSEKQTGIYSSK